MSTTLTDETKNSDVSIASETKNTVVLTSEDKVATITTAKFGTAKFGQDAFGTVISYTQLTNEPKN